MYNIDPHQMFFLGAGLLFIYLAIAKRVEPLLLLGIGTGMVLANIPLAHLASPPEALTPGARVTLHDLVEGGAGPLFILYYIFVQTELVPLFIFLGLGALTDFRPLIAQPYTFLLGAAAQLGVFVAMLGALLMGFRLNEAASIGIIGGADGPTTIYTAIKLAPYLLGPTALAAYTYMSLVPIIQPPIIRLLPKRHRAIKMKPPREVSRLEVLMFPILLMIVATLLVPKATPLIGMLALGNLFRESGITEVVERLSRTAANEFMNVLVIVLTVTIGSTMSVDMIRYYSMQMGITVEEFLVKFALIFLWGLFAFAVSTIGGVLFGEMMCIVTKGKVNPIIGAAGVSAVPMSARVCQREAQRVDSTNFILMNAMGPNVAGVIGTATVAGIYIDFVETFYTQPPY
uniref:Sodium ion-translocating decarboxylase subunit beta n=1 Tax=Fervidicoccus fontis TaxID=683846 RepID=A0A7J3ZJ16_9CREN